MILYHITKKKWLTSILTNGLIPGYRRGLRVNGKKCNTIFLTNDIEKIVNFQCGMDYVNKHELVVLHINTKDLKVEPTKYLGCATYTISDFEFETSKIEVDKIIKIEELKLKRTE